MCKTIIHEFNRTMVSCIQTLKDSLTSIVAHRRGTQRMETSLNLSLLDCIHPKRARVSASWVERNPAFWRPDFLNFAKFSVFHSKTELFEVEYPNDPSAVQSGDEGSGDEASEKPRLSVAKIWPYSSLLWSQKQNHAAPLSTASEHLCPFIQSTVAGTS